MKFSDFKADPAWDEKTLDQNQTYYKEIWEENEYFRHGLDVKEGDIVVDCGASIGFFSLLAASKKAKKIIAFESNSNSYKYLVENCKKNKKIVTENAFVNHRAIEVTGEKIPTKKVDLESILETYKLKKIDFLKLDVEGFEFGFILNEKDENIQKVKQFSIETHSCGFFTDKGQESHLTLAMMDKFNRLGYDCVIEKLHTNTCCYMMYAKLP
jgi:hypothetical protein